MLSFFHHIGIAFAASFMAFTGSFHHAPIQPVIAPIVQVEASSTPIIATTTIKNSPKNIVHKSKIEVVPIVDNSALIKAQVQEQVQAALKIKADQDAVIAKQQADAEMAQKIANAKQAADQAKASLEHTQQLYNQQLSIQQHQQDLKNQAQAITNNFLTQAATIDQQITNIISQYNKDVANLTAGDSMTMGAIEGFTRNLANAAQPKIDALKAQKEQLRQQAIQQINQLY